MSKQPSTPYGRKASGYVYREAARRMELNDDHVIHGSCCWAIHMVKTPEKLILAVHPEAQLMKSIYAPHGGVSWMYGIGDDESERHEGRILALCFMAAMVEAGDA